MSSITKLQRRRRPALEQDKFLSGVKTVQILQFARHDLKKKFLSAPTITKLKIWQRQILSRFLAKQILSVQCVQALSSGHAINNKTDILSVNKRHQKQGGQKTFLLNNISRSYLSLGYLFFRDMSDMFNFLSKNDVKTLCIEHLLNAKTLHFKISHYVIHGRVKTTRGEINRL